RRATFLAEATRLLSLSLDFDTTLARLREAVVPALADACQLVLRDPNGGYQYANADLPAVGDKSADQSECAHIASVSPALTKIVAEAIADGQTLPIDAAIVANLPEFGCQRQLTSAIVVPLSTREDAL